MVLDFLRSLLGGREEEPTPPPGPIEVELNEVVDLVRERTRGEARDSIDRVNELASNIRRRLEALEQLVEALDEEEVDNDEVDVRLIKAVGESRRHLQRKVAKAMHKVAFPQDERLDSLAEFTDSLDASLRMLTKASQAHVYYLSVVFPKDTKAVGEELRELVELHKELSKAMKGLRSIGGLDELAELVADAQEADVIGQRMDEETERLQDRLEVLEGEVTSLGAERQATEGELTEVEKELEDAREQLHEAGRRIETTLGGVKKALKKYQKTLDSGDESQVAAAYLKRPVATLVAEGPQHPQFSRLLDGLTTACDSRSLGIKKDKATKTKAALKQLQDGALAPHITSYTALAEEVQKKERNLAEHPVVQRAHEQDARLREMERETEKMCRELKSLEREADIVVRRRDTDLANIGRIATSLVGSRVRVVT
ncbi:MAG: hypothetical protein QF415_05980 [Candidatus Undinarchaeales archaeon]|jgi:uncharacterized protein Yka (UPF0111/DUF47 family)|nr:hypothetical protein [Candidatus Undinarchaeales archaeon]MDP7491401.1 hypothetical protein [Candidatus Undinarchaeales archaeon]